MTTNLERAADIIAHAMYEPNFKPPESRTFAAARALVDAGLLAPGPAGIDGQIVAADTNSTTELGGTGAYHRVYETAVTVEIDTRDLPRLDLTRPITIHQEPTDD